MQQNGWDHVFVPEDCWTRLAVELSATELSKGEDGDHGGEGDVPMAEIRGVINSPKEYAPSNNANVVPAASAQGGTSAAHAVTRLRLEGMQVLLSSLVNVPDAVYNLSSDEVRCAFIQELCKRAVRLSSPILGARAE